ncbi:hypothetical protein AV654_15010 [Paenibacillus elgii]|uniref:Gp5/Type VI secretion system Vgr protein OB-fold domain-containing protein n=1 Tax=Paenibacillus elgii TaxID=189691 RepID=A0A163YLQ3_9BACL|nr:contractile injection system protein, VgrG/Pvc8 family [Paenibacillus elgii]KZE79610.1 hypothetical protein AV654_15010 [Paenibacillus elgii]
MGVSVITYGNIEVGPFELTNLQDLQVIKAFNDHAKLTLTGIVPEERRDSYVQMANAQTQVKVVLTDDDGEQKTWFQGIIRNIQVQAVRGIYYLTVEAASHTCLLDVKLHKRSFQNPKMPYTELIRDILSGYDQADVIDYASDGEAIGTFVMQYEETDWQFLQRMASRFYTGLIPTTGFDSPKFYFGLPRNESVVEIQAAHYTFKKHIADYRNASENHIPGIGEADYIVYEVECARLLDVGQEVVFKSKPLVVGQAVAQMKDSLLTYTYQLYPRQGLAQPRIFNNAIIGASIQGHVLQIRQDTVRAKLDMDEQVDPSTDYWFPYSTIYASENNTGWYCMPEVNDRIRIYFPSNKEEEGIAISSVQRESPPSRSASAARHGDSGEDRMSDPAVKTFQTKYGKQIMLAPDRIVISSGKMHITISDKEGIEIKSDHNVIISADEDILMTSKNLKIKANKLELKGKEENVITLENHMEFKGSEIKMN